MALPQINIIAPLFNEEDVFDELIARPNVLMNESQHTIEVILVDDGSSDHTAEFMRQLSLRDPRYHSVFLSRNFGHQLDLTAGLAFVNATEGTLRLLTKKSSNETCDIAQLSRNRQTTFSVFGLH